MPAWVIIAGVIATMFTLTALVWLACSVEQPDDWDDYTRSLNDADPYLAEQTRSALDDLPGADRRYADRTGL